MLYYLLYKHQLRIDIILKKRQIKMDNIRQYLEMMSYVVTIIGFPPVFMSYCK